jgi:hypothetical protein
MFPPFIDSFGDQFSAVMINAVGAIMTAIFGAFVSGFLTPLFKSIAAAVGLPV